MKFLKIGIVILISVTLFISVASADENNTTAALEQGSGMVSGFVNGLIAPLIVPFVMLGCFLFIAWLYNIRS